ncbi:MAG: hypothetical protein EP344_01670 [Bacteroidetes bacterium]|nr:MAG: hypothetical protein EP344_01670 [Bacteroidota bacterium]
MLPCLPPFFSARKIALAAAGLLCLPLLVWTQNINTDYLRSINVRSIGPAAMSGRITAITCDPGNPEVIYAGAASGGVWRSTSGGTDWKPIFDAAPTQSIGAIAIHPQNPDLIWVGTGEGNPRNSQNFGVGIFKSIDGGRTWTHMGLDQTHTIHRIVLHRDNPDIIWAASMGSTYGPTQQRGVFKSTDGGKTWRKVLFVNDLTGCADLVADPSNPNKLYAAMWEYQRWPWFFKSGGKGSGLYVSYDGGETWSPRTEQNGLPKGQLGRIGVAVARSNPAVVYAIVEAEENALYRSDDGGQNWRKTTSENIGGRPFYYSEIYVDPQNENRIYSLHTYLNRSEDGGRSFDTWIRWEIHLDHHAFWIHPEDPDYMIDGNDGGLNITHDRGRTWRYAENIPVGQFYHINIDNDIPYNIYGGLQDNGSWVGPSAVWRSGGIRNSDWQEVMFGDGFDVVPRRDDNRYCFAMSQGGELGYVDIETGHSLHLKPLHPENVQLRWNWNAGIAQDPFSDSGIYFGSQFLHYSPDYGQTWQLRSPDLTTNDTSKLHQDISGGLTIDATNAENYCSIISIAPSPVDRNVIWVGTDDGNVQLTRDGGETWINLAERLPDGPEGGWVHQIEVSNQNAGEAFVVLNNYRQNDWTPYLYHTTDFGRRWKRLADPSRVDGFCLSVVQDPEVANLLFLGTDRGLYFSLNYGQTWTHWPRVDADKPGGLPCMPVQDMKIHPRDGDLVLGTYGRAVWVLDNIAALRELARDPDMLEQPFKLFKPQDAVLAAWRSYEGTRFSADAIYSGANKGTAAQIPVWVKPSPANAGAEKEADSDADAEQERPRRGRGGGKKEKATIWVLSTDGDTVRRWKTALDTCFGAVYWGLDTRGVEYPSNRKPDRDQMEPGRGPRVLPGKYKVMVQYHGKTDSVEVTVIDDPRLDLSIADREANAAAVRAFYPVIERSKAGYDRMLEAEKTIKLVESQFVHVPDSIKKEVLKLGKTLLDSIGVLKDGFFTQKEQKGIQRNPNQLNSTLRQAVSYIEASPGAPNGNARIAIEKARMEADQLLGRIDALFEGPWKVYREKAESIEFSLFKDE